MYFFSIPYYIYINGNHFAYSSSFTILFLFFTSLHFIYYMKLEIPFFLFFLFYHVMSFFFLFQLHMSYETRKKNQFTYSFDITSITTTMYKNQHITSYPLITSSDKRQMSCVLSILFQL